jgi:integrase
MPPRYNNSPKYETMGECMKGSVHSFKGSWFVAWYDAMLGKTVKIYHYKGEKIYSKKTAQKLLSVMQSDFENGTFYIEKYANQRFSEVIPFLKDWISHPDGLSPATHKGYKSYIENHIIPFFTRNNQLSLPDIQIDVLRRFRRGLEEFGLSPKMQWNIMYCMHSILRSAWESRKITAMPPFPRKKEYGLQRRPINWLPSDRQINILNEIPLDHQPIFWFLKYHLRRPAEACALHKVDYSDGVFEIWRSISNKKLCNQTKTGAIHTIPCHPDFLPFISIEIEKQKRLGIISPFLFVNRLARHDGKRYTGESLNIIWKVACKKAGEDIDLYSGLKHSSCSQYINEKGLSESELQIITDHARIESVRMYAKTEVKRKMELMMKNVFELKRDKKVE